MKLLAFLIFVTSLTPTDAIKCFECVNNENNCNSGFCEGDWCIAQYITKNPFASDHEQRVSKSCAKSHPTGFTNDSCVETISPSGRKLSCGCRKDYCNEDKAVQKLPVESHDDGGPVRGNGTVPAPNVPSTGDASHSNVPTGSMRCYCDEELNCVNNECRGGACTTQVYDETGQSTGAGVRIGTRISKGCTAFMPVGIQDNQVKRPATVSLANGKTVNTEVTIFYCNDRDYCNNNAIGGQSLLSAFVLLVSIFFLFVSA